MITEYDDQVWWRHYTAGDMRVTEYSLNGVDWIKFSDASVRHIQDGTH
jgi:hypothetical protein